MDSVTINNTQYYPYDTIIQTHPQLKYGKYRSEFIKRYRIPKTDHMYARFTNKWNQIDRNAGKNDTLFISKIWFHENISIEDVVPQMPQPIILDDSEMFVNDDGNFADILVVGERQYDKCFFFLKDIIDNFELHSAYKTVKCKDNGYIIGTHYAYFSFPKIGNHDDRIVLKKKQIFLTYHGLLKLLYTSRKGKHENFLIWATRTVFTAHLGTPEQKRSLVASLLGASPEAVNEVFNTFARCFSCVYLLQIGTVGDLRESMNIDEGFLDTDMVVKYGRTDSLKRRTKEHNSKRSYGGIKGAKIRLLCNARIDPRHLSKAEIDIAMYFFEKGCLFSYKKYEELAIVPKELLSSIKAYYEIVERSYSGYIRELLDEIEIVKGKMANELALKDIEIADKNTEIAKKDTEIARKDIEKKALEVELAKKDTELAKKDHEIYKLKRQLKKAKSK